jgi:hypothetical protein
MAELLDFHGHPAAVLAGFLILALASARLTRLVVKDKLTTPYVEKFVQVFHRRAERLTVRAEESQDQRHLRRAVRADGRASQIEYLLNCSWCTSVWASLALVVAWVHAGTTAVYGVVVLTLAVSEVAAQIRRREP